MYTISKWIGWGDSMINHILKASKEKHWIVTIMYQKNQEITKRNIKVLDITQDQIKAFCYLRNELRVFKKENILAASLYSKKNKQNTVKQAANQ